MTNTNFVRLSTLRELDAFIALYLDNWEKSILGGKIYLMPHLNDLSIFSQEELWEEIREDFLVDKRLPFYSASLEHASRIFSIAQTQVPLRITLNYREPANSKNIAQLSFAITPPNSTPQLGVILCDSLPLAFSLISVMLLGHNLHIDLPNVSISISLPELTL